MNILCKIKGHQFVADRSGGAGWSENGNCKVLYRCERCGETEHRAAGTPHTFLPHRQKTEINCYDPKEDHTCWESVSNTCTTCGYVQTTRTKVFYFKKTQPRQGCTNIEICPNCQLSFDFKDLPHQYDQVVKIEARKEGCHQVMQCSRCGKQTSYWDGNDVVILPHEWSEFTVVSRCERFRSCARCGYKEEIVTHQWQPTGEKWNIRDYEVGGGTEESWDEAQVCPVCKQRRVVTRTYSPPF